MALDHTSFHIKNLFNRSIGLGFKKDYDIAIFKMECVSRTKPISKTGKRLLSCNYAREHGHGHILATTSDEGELTITNTESRDYENHPHKINNTHIDAVNDVAWSPWCMNLVTASKDETCTLWTILPDGTAVPRRLYLDHYSPVRTLAFKPDSKSQFASAANDHKIYLWEEYLARDCISNAGDHKEPGITGLAFPYPNTLVSSGSTVRVWDLRMVRHSWDVDTTPVAEFPHPGGSDLFFTDVAVRNNNTRAYAVSSDMKIYRFNIKSLCPEPELVYSGFNPKKKAGNMKIDFSPDEKYFACTNGSTSIHVYRTDYPEMVARMRSTLYTPYGLSGISWCPQDILKISTTSRDVCHWVRKWTDVGEEAANKKSKGVTVSLSKRWLNRHKVESIAVPVMRNSSKVYKTQVMNKISKKKIPYRRKCSKTTSN